MALEALVAERFRKGSSRLTGPRIRRNFGGGASKTGKFPTLSLPSQLALLFSGDILVVESSCNCGL